MTAKRIACLLLSVATLIPLCGCGGTDKKTDDQTTEPAFSYVPETEFVYAEELTPIWTGNVVYDEYVMFLGTDDEVPLLYPATEIISVKSTNGKTTFVEGVDYVLVDGKLKMPEGSSLTYIPEDVYWAKGVYDVYTYKDGVKHITYAAGVDGMAKYQVAVTYKHASTSPVTVEDRSASFKNLIKKLENGEDVTIVFYGDSITEGWDSSLRGIYGQRQPHWPALVTQYLAYTYGYNIKYVSNALKGVFNYPKAKESFGERGTIYYINTAVGGWKVADAFANYQNYVLNPAEKYGGADIIFYAFGMNDSSLHPLDYKYAVNKTMEKILEVTPNTPIVLVSSMLPNTESVSGTGKIAQQEEQLYIISEAMKEKGFAVEVAPMTRVHTHICSVKRYRDHSGNNMNHPGDYTHRIYAQVALQTILGYAD